MTQTVSHPLPMIHEEVETVRVERLSPSFVRVELGGACLADFGVDGPLYDQRIKLVFPSEGGAQRTYTVREVRGEGAATRIVVDFVLHVEDGESGPGSAWAASAAIGDRVVLMAPRRGVEFGGIEFDPGTATRLLLAGDETAVPAICTVLEQLSDSATGAAFLEVPTAADVQEVRHPDGVEVMWLPRAGAALGSMLQSEVLAHLGAGAAPLAEPEEIDPDLWETPSYSSSGEAVEAALTLDGYDHADLYAWIAGESGVVTALRRALVRDLGMDRRQVAFMGYWRRGVAMRS